MRLPQSYAVLIFLAVSLCVGAAASEDGFVHKTHRSRQPRAERDDSVRQPVVRKDRELAAGLPGAHAWVSGSPIIDVVDSGMDDDFVLLKSAAPDFNDEDDEPELVALDVSATPEGRVEPTLERADPISSSYDAEEQSEEEVSSESLPRASPKRGRNLVGGQATRRNRARRVFHVAYYLARRVHKAEQGNRHSVALHSRLTRAQHDVLQQDRGGGYALAPSTTSDIVWLRAEIRHLLKPIRLGDVRPYRNLLVWLRQSLKLMRDIARSPTGVVHGLPQDALLEALALSLRSRLTRKIRFLPLRPRQEIQAADVQRPLREALYLGTFYSLEEYCTHRGKGRLMDVDAGAVHVFAHLAPSDPYLDALNLGLPSTRVQRLRRLSRTSAPAEAKQQSLCSATALPVILKRWR